MLIFLFGLPRLVVAQLVTDTVPNKTDVYEVKKKSETINDIAKKLKVDAVSICSLNNITNVDSLLTRGQKIVVPAYFKTSGKPAKPADITAKQSATDNKEVVKATQTTLPPVDTELIQNQILLTDATLDLNRTLLQGIQASLDSLNVKDRNVIDEKNIALTIHRMQRQRDKAMLTPVLLHMQDSLKNEIVKGEAEKVGFEKMLSRQGSYVAPADTTPKTTTANKVLVKTDTIKPVSTSLFDDTAKTIVKTEVKEETPVKKDTTDIKVVIAESKTNHVRQVIEIGSSTPTEATEVPVMHWETAKAIYYNDDTTQAEQNPNELTSAKPALNNTGDTTAYKPGITKEDSAKPQVGSEEARIIRAKYFYTKALKDISQKNFNEAVSYLKKSIDLSPRYYDAWLALGEADAHSGLYTKALNELKYCKTMDSTSALLFYKMGVVETKLKQKTEALNSFNRALKLNPDYIPAIISRAAEYADRGQFKTAIREYNRVLQLDPAYHTIYKQRAMAHLALKNYEAAIDDFSRFLIFNETDASVYYHRGMARLELKQMTDACTDFSLSAKLGSHAAAKALAEHCK